MNSAGFLLCVSECHSKQAIKSLHLDLDAAGVRGRLGHLPAVRLNRARTIEAAIEYQLTMGQSSQLSI